MSKAKEAAEELVDWLSGLDESASEEVMGVVGEVLAGLPGGDEFADVGFTPLDGVDWKAFELIGILFSSIKSKRDVEAVSQVLLDSVEDEDEESEAPSEDAASEDAA